MSSASLDQQTLDKIAERFSESIRRGDNPSIEAILKKYPDESGQLRELLTSIQMIESLKRSSDPSKPGVAQQQLAIEQLDDYRIVREIGRGGMGVVFEAVDQSLHRQVAIKVLPGGLLSEPRYLERFRSEATAAARLRHPNIVSVFGVGQSGEHHYYVMDLIDGINLRQWLDTFNRHSDDLMPTGDQAITGTASSKIRWGAANSPPTSDTIPPAHLPGLPDRTDSKEYFHWAANLGVMVCDALHYAHSQGTLHRDIKPANLLIDRRGNVSLTDFGLAKVAEQQGVTRTGDILGTPQYMAPESFDGHYDCQSEIYAVGLTLYELLTLRPAITASSPAELIRKAAAGVTVKPRRRNQAIPRDLETVVLKALAIAPQDRYRGVDQLGDDLRCFLRNLPIAARRSSLAQRALRWSRREPMVASLTLATFVSITALAAVSATAYFRTKAALDEAEQSRQAATEALSNQVAAFQVAQSQRSRAEANLNVAISAFDQIREHIWQRSNLPDAEILGEVGDTSSSDINPADAEILQALVGFFDELAANNHQDLRSQSAAAARRAGDIYQQLGKLPEANRAYSQALEKYRSLAEEIPKDESLVIEQARVMNEQIVTASLQGQIQRASILFDQTTSLLKQSPSAMTSAAGRFEYARAHALFASIIARAGIDALPVRRFRSGGRIPKRPGVNSITMRIGEELFAVSEAIEVLSQLAEEFPQETKYHVALARAFRDQSKVFARAGLRGDSSKAIKKSIDHFESLFAENRDSDAIGYELAKTLSSSEALGISQMLRIMRAEMLSGELLRHSPTLPRYQALRAHVLDTLAQHRHRAGKRELAEQNLQQALRLYDALIEASPELSLYRTKKSQSLESFAELKMRAGDRAAAVDYMEQAIAELQSANHVLQTSPIARMQLQQQRQKLARFRDLAGTK
ncbi:MAG: serine/threonine protein kinase [Pirellulales bacterium]|nr:serine/threonine protein kinase [Pirellulales bacterium]